MADPWTQIHTERQALLSDVEPLSDEAWATASLCAGWTIHDVLAHQTATARMTPAKFMGKWIASGFRFNTMAAKDVRSERGSGPADTLATFKAHLDSKAHPPGPIQAMVGEAVIHGEDMRRPLGIRRAYPEDTLVTVADFVTRGNLLLGGKRRSAGLTLKATDASWTHGSGPEVSGPLASIILAVTGRKAGLDDLEGAGLDTLRARV